MTTCPRCGFAFGACSDEQFAEHLVEHGRSDAAALRSRLNKADDLLRRWIAGTASLAETEGEDEP